jgi:hypothetical protein
MTQKEIPTEKRWANDLKVGDVVFVSSFVLSRQELSKVEVTKLTEIRIYVGKSNREFKRHDLTRKIGSYSWEHLLPVTPENEKTYKHNQLSDAVYNLAHAIDVVHARKSTIEEMTIDELAMVKIAMESVCSLFTAVEKRLMK